MTRTHDARCKAIADIQGKLREYRLTYGTPDVGRALARIAHAVATLQGHNPLRQGESVECARCGASGSAREVLSGPVHLEPCAWSLFGSVPSKVTYNPRATPEDVSDHERKRAALRPTRRKRSPPRTYSRAPLERAGLARLTDPTPDPSERAVWVVRIYYRSMGGEVLACDSEPMTPAGRDALLSHVRGSEAIACDEYRTDSPRGGVPPKHQPWLRHGARLVILPSQMHADDVSAIEVAA